VSYLPFTQLEKPLPIKLSEPDAMLLAPPIIVEVHPLAIFCKPPPINE
jgi:hypothetical protein